MRKHTSVRIAGRFASAVAAAGVLAGLVAGVPAILLLITGSPIPDRAPSRDEVTWALLRRDDGTVLLHTLRYLAWAVWAVWIWLMATEAAARLRGSTRPPRPGCLAGPQHLAALLIATLTTTGLTPTHLDKATAASTGVALDEPPIERVRAQHRQPSPVTGPRIRHPASPPHTDDASPHHTRRPAPGRRTAVAALHARPAGQEAERVVTVRFGFDSAALSATAIRALQQAATDISGHADPARPVTIAGHTDGVGPTGYNHDLSLRRATAVRNALTPLLPPYPMRVSGSGETQPIARERFPDGSDNPLGRARNRRVEITYTPTPDPPTTPRPAPPHGEPRPTTPPPASAAPAGPPTASRRSGPTVGDDPSSPVAVDLPTGALVGLGLATAVAAAAAATRLHQRRRRHLPLPAPNEPASSPTGPSQPWPPAAAESVPDLPPAVRALRAAALQATRHTPTAPSDAALVAEDFGAAPPTHLPIGIGVGNQSASHTQPHADHEKHDEQHDGPAAPEARGDDAAGEQAVPLAGLSVGLSGAGADDAVRAAVTELLAHAYRGRIELIIPERDLTALYAPPQTEDGTADPAWPQAPGLVLAPDLDSALLRLETEIVHRARLLAELDAPDVATVRSTDPGEPVPPLVLIATSPQPTDQTHVPDQLTRLSATLRDADRYGIGALLLGACPEGTSCHVDADGRVQSAQGPDAGLWRGVQLFHLTTVGAAQLLQVLHTAHDGVPPPSPGIATATTRQPAPTPDRAQAADLMGELPEPAEPESKGGLAAPVRLQLLGTVQMHTRDGGQIVSGLRHISRELLALLAVRADGITRDEGTAALWPDGDPRTLVTQFHTAVGNVRAVLRAATGLTESAFIIYRAGRYRLDPHLIDIDLWRLRHALRTATRSAITGSMDNGPPAEDDDHLRALERVADLYTADLADELTDEWAAAEREHLRRSATDALTRLADLLRQRGLHEHALIVLGQAFDHDPYSDALAQQLMRLQARLGRPDAVRRTYRLLTHRLTELGVDPDQQTQDLLTDLLRPRHPRPPQARPHRPGR